MKPKYHASFRHVSITHLCVDLISTNTNIPSHNVVAHKTFTNWNDAKIHRPSQQAEAALVLVNLLSLRCFFAHRLLHVVLVHFRILYKRHIPTCKE